MTARMLVGVIVAVLGAASQSRVLVQAAPPRAMELRLHQVKAVDECGSGIEEWGHDKMTLGAVAVQNGTGRVQTLDLGKFGHDKSTRNFKTPRPFVTFNVKPGIVQRFQAHLVLAERDVSGGFDTYLKKYAAAVPKKLVPPKSGKGAHVDPKQVAQAAATIAATGLETGTAIEIGRQVAAELGKRFKDDIFTSYLEQIVVKADGTYNKNELKPVTRSFKAPGCHYTVTYSWAAK